MLLASTHDDEGDSSMTRNVPKIRPIQIAGIVVLAAVAALGLYLVFRERVTSEEAQIRRLISDVERAFENKKLSKCMAVVADDYSDNFVARSKDELEQTLRLLFQSSKRIRVSLDDITIRIHGDTATITLIATGTAETLYGDISLHRESGYTDYRLAVRKDRGRWKLVRAEGIK
jgi:ketosteroid isomerase-like protein